MARLFLRAIVDNSRDGKLVGYWSKSRSNNNNTDNSKDTELKRRQKDQWLDTTTATTGNWQDEENNPSNWGHHERSESRISRAQQPEHVDDGYVTVKTDIVVQVDDGRSVSSGGARLLPEGSEPPPGTVSGSPPNRR